MKIIIFKGYWTVEDVRTNNKYLFIFGDNDIKRAKGGQAIIRYEPNTIGIPTKKYPSYNSNAYYYDTEYDDNIKKIDTAIENIIIILKTGKYKGIILPADGFGTGLANLKINAPKTLKYIEDKVNELKEIVKVMEPAN